jgi:uncharacterized protein (TIGR03546 family)
LFFRIQIGAALVTAFFFAFPAYMLDPLFDRVGVMILEAQSLQWLWTQLYNLPIVPFARFYNSIVMGSGVVALLLSPLVFFLAVVLVRRYREVVVERFKNSKFWKAVKATSLYKWYFKYDQLYG